MIARRRPMMLAMALIALCAAAVPASAQITTGSVAGTVKDPQGGVIPGAPVTLISETRGTQLSDVFSNSSGDFSFVNVPPDRYTLQVSMTGFKTAKRTGISVSAGDRALVGVVTVEVGGLTETIQVTSEAALVNTQSGERSFTVTTDSVENLPIANRSFTALASLAPGVTGTTRIGGGGGNNIMMDGVSAVDTGSNAILLQMNVESIAEVKVLVSGYQAEYGRSSGLQITAVTKSGTNQFRGSAYSRLPQLRLVTPTAGRIFSTATQRPSCRKRTWATRLAARSGNRAAGTSSSSFTATSMRREPAGTTSSGSGSRRRSNGPGTSRRRSTTTARCTRISRTPTSPAHARRRARSPASGTAACSGASRPTGSTRRA